MDTTNRFGPRQHLRAVTAAAEQPSLPLDDLDEPVPYMLTPRAVAAVSVRPPQEELPDLDDEGDTRRAAARALRRGGLSPSRIARRLGVDELAVRVWIGESRPVRATDENPDRTPELPTIDRDERRFRTIRDRAADELAARLSSVAFTRGLSLVAATAVVDRHAVLVTTADDGVATRVVSWLRDHADAPADRIRVVVRLASRRGGDLAVRRWADQLGVDPSAVRLATWTAPPRPDAVEVLVRVADPTVAATVTGWRDALLAMEDPDRPLDRVAF